jgi:hypothetical protein
MLRGFLISSFVTLALVSVNSLAASCATSIEKLNQIAHVSQSGSPEHLENYVLGRFKADHGFYVFDYRDQIYLGIDGGFLLGKKAYPVSVCLKGNRTLLISADLDGSRQSLSVKIQGDEGSVSLLLSGGTGKLASFNGVYPRNNKVSAAEIIRMFESAL